MWENTSHHQYIQYKTPWSKNHIVSSTFKFSATLTKVLYLVLSPTHTTDSVSMCYQLWMLRSIATVQNVYSTQGIFCDKSKKLVCDFPAFVLPSPKHTRKERSFESSSWGRTQTRLSEFPFFTLLFFSFFSSLLDDSFWIRIFVCNAPQQQQQLILQLSVVTSC